MKFKKQALLIDEQINLLRSRGLIIQDVNFAKSNLSNISYYRLSAYMYVFQNLDNTKHEFKANTKIEQIISIYNFDRELRLIFFDAIEKIEISLRTQIIYNFSVNFGPYWYLDSNLFRDLKLFEIHLNSLQNSITFSRENFIKHYKEKYTFPLDPPSWMSLEVATFSLLSKIFNNLKLNKEKDVIVNFYGLNKVDILENWLLCMVHIRNICAHHSRLWNRKLTKIVLVKVPKNRFINIKHKNNEIDNSKLYSHIVCFEYILRIINPHFSIKNSINNLFQKYPDIDITKLGFPYDWLEDSFWHSEI